MLAPEVLGTPFRLQQTLEPAGDQLSAPFTVSSARKIQSIQTSRTSSVRSTTPVSPFSYVTAAFTCTFAEPS